MTLSVSFAVDGMTDAQGAARVERALSGVNGVEKAQACLETDSVTLRAAAMPGADVLEDVLGEFGCSVRRATGIYRIDGMTCSACAAGIQRALAAMPGILHADVNFVACRARVTGITPSLDDTVRSAVGRAGYAARPAAEADRARDEETRHRARLDGLVRRLTVAASFTVPLVVLSMGRHTGLLEPWMSRLMAPRGWMVAELLLTLPVMVFAAGEFYRAAIGEFRRLAPGMNSLVALGTAAAFGYSLVALAAPGLFPAGTAVSYFEAAAVIVTLIVAGRFLEETARARASDAVGKLMRLVPETALVRLGGRDVERPVESIVPGDLVVVRPGERFAVDGEVVKGSGHVDESMITGESAPVARKPGDAVTGGTLNGQATLVTRAGRVGADTVLARIVRMVGGRPDVAARDPAHR